MLFSTILHTIKCDLLMLRICRTIVLLISIDYSILHIIDWASNRITELTIYLPSGFSSAELVLKGLALLSSILLEGAAI